MKRGDALIGCSEPRGHSVEGGSLLVRVGDEELPAGLVTFVGPKHSLAVDARPTEPIDGDGSLKRSLAQLRRDDELVDGFVCLFERANDEPHLLVEEFDCPVGAVHTSQWHEHGVSTEPEIVDASETDAHWSPLSLVGIGQ